MEYGRKCDRCGKLYENARFYPFPQIKIVDEFSDKNQRAYLDSDTLELCFNCALLFFDWLENSIK